MTGLGSFGNTQTGGASPNSLSSRFLLERVLLLSRRCPTQPTTQRRRDLAVKEKPLSAKVSRRESKVAPFTVRLNKKGLQAMGELIYAERNMRNWTQATLAEKAGICVPTLIRLEYGDYVKGPFLYSLISVLNCLSYDLVAKSR